MATEKKKYFVMKPIMHRNQPYQTGARVSLIQREAQFLILAGKIGLNPPQTKKGHKNVEHHHTAVPD
ncbi:hypothetical protein [Candidatus Williamhamiltonella defendens]|uniref:hypothetical protein n=1 Tax=Candidatus Williamhamiltonella defendens TaxID=138072 RepID=UPI0012FDD73D|nr:hypothetical protein [Candidatus Hamiltonella defensa]